MQKYIPGNRGLEVSAIGLSCMGLIEPTNSPSKTSGFA